MGRRNSLKENQVVSVRIENDIYHLLHDIASLESINTGKKIGIQQLIRNAIDYVYKDNERLRECFRKSRQHITKRFK